MTHDESADVRAEPGDIGVAHARFVAAVEKAWDDYIAATTSSPPAGAPDEPGDAEAAEVRHLLGLWSGVLGELRLQAELGSMEAYDRVGAVVHGLRSVIDGSIARLWPRH